MLIDTLIDRIKFLVSKDKELYSSLHQILGFYPHDISYYKLALMHKSMMRRNEKGRLLNNERLEFLGDAVLDAAVGDIVYRHFPGKREGFLTTARSKLVQRKTLNKVAEEIGLTQLIKISDNASLQNNNISGNAFEALVGAIYLDKGYYRCMEFMEKRVLAQQLDIDKVAYKVKNFKSKLIEWCQRNKMEIRFDLVEQSTDKVGTTAFKSVVYLETVRCGEGSGSNKKDSEQKAAELTMERLKNDPKFIDEVFLAKSTRTNMEEEPVSLIKGAETVERVEKQASGKAKVVPLSCERPSANNSETPALTVNNTVFDLDDIHVRTNRDKSRDEIIAAAEEAAFDE